MSRLRGITRIASIAVAAVAPAVCAQALSAQDGHTGLSVDGVVGFGHGWSGGEKVNRSLITADLLVAVRVAGDPHGGLLIGVESSRYWQVNGDLLCLTGSDGECIPQYPGFDALNLVGGYHRQWLPALRVRILGGPGYYTAYFDRGHTRNHSVGIGVRADVAGHLLEHVSWTVAARAAWVPRIRGESHMPGAVMIGLRFETDR